MVQNGANTLSSTQSVHLVVVIKSRGIHIVRALGNTSDEHCANTVYKQINDIFVIRYNGQILPDIVTLKKNILKNVNFFMMPIMQNAEINSVKMFIVNHCSCTFPPLCPGLELAQQR